jgi:hypothetical protein
VIFVAANARASRFPAYQRHSVEIHILVTGRCTVYLLVMDAAKLFALAFRKRVLNESFNTYPTTERKHFIC